MKHDIVKKSLSERLYAKMMEEKEMFGKDMIMVSYDYNSEANDMLFEAERGDAIFAPPFRVGYWDKTESIDTIMSHVSRVMKSNLEYFDIPANEIERRIDSIRCRIQELQNA